MGFLGPAFRRGGERLRGAVGLLEDAEARAGVPRPLLGCPPPPVPPPGCQRGCCARPPTPPPAWGSIYSVLLERLGGADGTPPPFLAKAAIGMTAGAAGAFVGTPAEVALIRMTADGR